MAQMAVIVRAGDTFGSLRARYGATEQDIARLNPNVKELKGGQIVYIPKKDDPKPKPGGLANSLVLANARSSLGLLGDVAPFASQLYTKLFGSKQRTPAYQLPKRGDSPLIKPTGTRLIGSSSQNLGTGGSSIPHPNVGEPANSYKQFVYKTVENYVTDRLATVSDYEIGLIAGRLQTSRSLIEKSLTADGFVKDDNGFWIQPERAYEQGRVSGDPSGGYRDYGDRLSDSFPMTYEGNRALEQAMKEDGYTGNKVIMGNEIIRRNSMGVITSRIEIKGSGAGQGLNHGWWGHAEGGLGGSLTTSWMD